jgi:hypothetical protein
LNIIDEKIVRLFSIALLLLSIYTGSTATVEAEESGKQYIVVLKEDHFSIEGTTKVSGETINEVVDRLIGLARDNQMLIDAEKGIIRSNSEAVNQKNQVFNGLIYGFSATLTDEAVDLLSKRYEVKYIEVDGVSYDNSGIQVNVQSWGLDRLDQRNLPINNLYAYYADGTGVNVYVIDSGLANHHEFGDRVEEGYNFVDNNTDLSDCKGHGTHVTGIIAGRSVGVAKDANIIPLKVSECGQIQNSHKIAALQWVFHNHQRPAVVNLSNGGGTASVGNALEEALENLIAAGVTVVVSAGNSGTNACNVSTARTPNAITVAASDASDSRAVFPDNSSSNIGPCVDVFAPGSNIRSTFVPGLSSYGACADDGNGYAYCDGTSMAAPFVTGLAAIYLEQNPMASPGEVKSAIISASTKGVLTNIGAGTPNRLAYNALHRPITHPDIVAVAYIDSEKMACAWYENSTVSCGSTHDLDSVRSPYPYSLPAGYEPTDIADVAWIESYRMACAFYKDGKVSCGSTRDLDSKRSLYSYKLPSNVSPKDIVGIAYLSDEKMACAWYANNQESSCGTTRDFSIVRKRRFTLPATAHRLAMKGVAWLEHLDMACAWYANGTASCGSRLNLGDRRAPYEYKILN